MTQDSAQELSVIELCAGAGGQSLGLHRAGFRHRLAIEIDPTAAETLTDNLHVPVAVGDVASRDIWHPEDYRNVTLLAGGVPCPPFSLAGKQLGASDERDLFAWAIEQVPVIEPKAIMLENVRGLASPRFSAYRQRVLDRLDGWGYVGEWKLISAADFGVPQLRPRFVLVGMQRDDFEYFHWPQPTVLQHTTVGDALHDLMGERGWRHADEWRQLADSIGPTLVGGSKKHGGADLGPTRAREAWSKLYVDGRGIVDSAPSADAPSAKSSPPRLTVGMAARIQGWTSHDAWRFAGKKTSQYRQIGNAFPPPVAEAIGTSLSAALRRDAKRRDERAEVGLHDAVYRALASAQGPLTFAELLRAHDEGNVAAVERKLAAIRHDFNLEVTTDSRGVERFSLGQFRGFVGQLDHLRHDFVSEHRSQVS